MTKAELRKYYRAQRQQFSPEQIEQVSQILGDLFFRFFPLASVRYLHCFLPIRRQQEIDTHLIITRLRKEYPEIRIVLPRVQGDRLGHYLWDEQLQFAENAWGIIEPAEGTPVDPALLDLVIVPLLVADQQGNRVGYGKGFYDRFLAGCRPDTLKVGVSYWNPVARIDDIEPWDVPLDYCVTPERVWRFGKTTPA